MKWSSGRKSRCTKSNSFTFHLIKKYLTYISEFHDNNPKEIEFASCNSWLLWRGNHITNLFLYDRSTIKSRVSSRLHHTTLTSMTPRTQEARILYSILSRMTRMHIDSYIRWEEVCQEKVIRDRMYSGRKKSMTCRADISCERNRLASRREINIILAYKPPQDLIFQEVSIYFGYLERDRNPSILWWLLGFFYEYIYP